MDGHYATPSPSILRHESAGIVEAVGSELRYVKLGDHVITCLSVFCGHCGYWTTGRPFSCDNAETARVGKAPSRLSQGGEMIHQFYDLSSFAEQMLIYEQALVKVREDMPLDRAAQIGCAVTTGFGATHVVNGTTCVPVEAIRELTSGGVEHSFEALGRKQTTEQAFRMLRRPGVATIIGMAPEGQMIEIDAADLINDKRLQGSNMGSNRFRVDMPRYFDFYLRGQLKLDAMISRRITLEQINEAFDEMKRGEVARSVVMFDD